MQLKFVCCSKMRAMGGREWASLKRVFFMTINMMYFPDSQAVNMFDISEACIAFQSVNEVDVAIVMRRVAYCVKLVCMCFTTRASTACMLQCLLFPNSGFRAEVVISASPL